MRNVFVFIELRDGETGQVIHSIRGRADYPCSWKAGVGSEIVVNDDLALSGFTYEPSLIGVREHANRPE